MLQKPLDSALFVERLDFVRKRLNHWYEPTAAFGPIVQAGDSHPLFRQMPEQTRYMFVNHLRSMCVLMWDGLSPDGKGNGHVLRKLARSIVGSMHGMEPTEALVGDTIQGVRDALLPLRYDISSDLKAIQESIYSLLTKSHRQIHGELAKFESRLDSAREIRSDELNMWITERGIHPSWIRRIVENRQMSLDIPESHKKFWFRNECYSFDPKKRLDNPRQFLIDAESKRMGGAE
uniref:alanine--tRNA ligase-related protein n=1 Tax=Sulfobacillus thermotolerans TaxID=338644 RepID=UPI003D71CFCB